MTNYLPYGDFTLTKNNPREEEFDPLILRIPRGTSATVHGIDKADALRLAVSILDGLEAEEAPAGLDPLKNGLENAAEAIAEGLHKINSKPSESWADADINFKTYLRGTALPLALAASRALAPAPEVTEAAERITEYLRQFEKQTSIDVTVIHTVSTDPEADPAAITPADLKLLLAYASGK